MTIKEYEAKARELRELQALIDEAQTEAEAIKDEIKAAMGDTECVQAGEYKITYKTLPPRELTPWRLKRLYRK